jgi:nucleolysin TIA-1/TIAR
LIPVTAADLTQVFTRVGPVTNVHCPAAGSYAFVDFERHDDAARAITTLDGQDLKGSAMKLSWGQGSRKQTTAQQKQSAVDAAAIAEAESDPDNTKGNPYVLLLLYYPCVGYTYV